MRFRESGENNAALSGKRIRGFDAFRHIMVPSDGNNRALSVPGQPFQCPVEQIKRLGRRIEGIEQITGNENHICMLIIGDGANLVQDLYLLPVTGKPLQPFTKVPVGGMENSDHIKSDIRKVREFKFQKKFSAVPVLFITILRLNRFASKVQRTPSERTFGSKIFIGNTLSITRQSALLIFIIQINSELNAFRRFYQK